MQSAAILIHSGTVHAFRKCALSLAKPALAALLAGFILLLVVLPDGASFHQRMHAAGSADGSGCLICLLAHGQVDLAAPVPVWQAARSPSFESLPSLAEVFYSTVDLRLSPSRAPPLPSSTFVG